MTDLKTEDVSCEFLTRLPDLTVDPVRAERTRLQCRALLEQQRRRRDRVEVRRAGGRPVVRFAAVGAFCAFCLVYLSALVATLRAPFGQG